ncbi:hypothetical protein ACFCYM_33405 [Streptomyces sp. NPDC056254]|uniref:hypothetical protein n=1 Tax=Streptomyces sp. NPDC056254 TaxID=3345763 RepID=UPI0035DB5CB6
MAQEKEEDRSPLERVTGESDVSPQEQRERGAAPSGGKGRIQEAAGKVKDAAREALGTGKREPTEATPEAEEMLRERRERSDRSDGSGGG